MRTPLQGMDSISEAPERDANWRVNTDRKLISNKFEIGNFI